MLFCNGKVPPTVVASEEKVRTRTYVTESDRHGR